MRIEHSTAFVSGANRGVGAGFVAGLLARGARKVYAGMRDPDAARFDDPRVVPVRLDVTVPAQVAEAAALAGDVSLLINNAGINRLERVAEPR